MTVSEARQRIRNVEDVISKIYRTSRLPEKTKQELWLAQGELQAVRSEIHTLTKEPE